jgi:hypothetical protein
MLARMAAFAGIFGAGAALGADADIVVPSGQPITFVEVVRDAQGPEGLTYRFRFLAPQIAREGGQVTAEQALEDMAQICDSFALPRVTSALPEVQQIVISLSNRPIEFGQTDPEATQYFEAFSPGGDACIWNGF